MGRSFWAVALVVAGQLGLGCGGRTEGSSLSDCSGGASQDGGSASGGRATPLGGRSGSGGARPATGGTSLTEGGSAAQPPPSLSTWYVYADGFGSNGQAPGDCQLAGHSDAECSTVLKPTPSPNPFPVSGPLCSAGVAARVVFGFDGAVDYAHIWGAGIGLDFTSNGVRAELNALAEHVVGLSFTIDSVPVAGLRVEFPTATRDPQMTGWDYWGASSLYPPSPVKTGENQVIFSQVRSPTGGGFDMTRVTGVQFHVPMGPTRTTQYSFCISDVRLLRN